MRYHSSGSDNSISCLRDDIARSAFGESDNDALLLRHGCGGSGEENKGKQYRLRELHCVGIAASGFVLWTSVVF